MKLRAVVLLAGCGGSSARPDASVAGDGVVVTVDAGSDANPFDARVATADATPLASCTPVAGSTVVPRKIGTVNGVAILATSPPNDGRLFVIEQAGAIRIFNKEQLITTPFLDVTPFIVSGDELGLLGLAFHPNYANNGRFFIDYTANNPVQGTSNPYVDVVAEYEVSGDPDVAKPTGKILISIPDFGSAHNGGMLEFGSDGLLYISTGDGGSNGDSARNGQNPNTLLGKMLRIDVDHTSNGNPYAIPAGNPYALAGGAPEVFMLGMRNPWRWSFDRANGTMFIGDVGQAMTEEIDVLLPAQQAGANLGWSAYEGNGCCATQSDHCLQAAPYQACNPAGLHFPQDTRSHLDGWNAIIGGQVYRGTCFPRPRRLVLLHRQRQGRPGQGKSGRQRRADADHGSAGHVPVEPVGHPRRRARRAVRDRHQRQRVGARSHAMRSRRVALATGLTYHALEWAHDGDLTFVLVHGFADLGWGWIQVAERLAQHAHVIAPDLRGHGDSDRIGPGGYYHFMDYVADLDDVIARLARKRVILVGHSMGGSVSGYYAGTRPERLVGLALLEGLGPPDLAGIDPAARTAMWIDAWKKARVSYKPIATLEEAAARLRKNDPLLDEAFALAFARAGTNAVEGGYVWKHDPLHMTQGPYAFRVDTAARFWQRVTCPTLILDGSESRLNLPDAERAARRASFATHRHEVVPAAGHALQRHQPERVAELIRSLTP